MLQQDGYLSGEGKPTRKALDNGLVDQCGRHLIWNLDRVSQCLAAQGCEVVRRSVNQEIATPRGGGPSWVNLATIGTYSVLLPGRLVLGYLRLGCVMLRVVRRGRLLIEVLPL